jgi:hypothetical protein
MRYDIAPYAGDASQNFSEPLATIEPNGPIADGELGSRADRPLTTHHDRSDVLREVRDMEDDAL